MDTRQKSGRASAGRQAVRRRERAALGLIAVGALLAAAPATGAEKLPAAVAKAAADLRKQCRGFGGKPGASGVAHVADLTGDGIADYVVYGPAVDCDGALSAMAGGQLVGAEFEVYIGAGDGTAGKALVGEAFGLRVDQRDSPARLIVEVAGRACGQRDADQVSVAAVEHCERALVWRPGQRRFVLGPKVSAPAVGEASAETPTVVAAPPTMRDLCAGRSHCHDGHAFTAEVVRVQVFSCEVSPWGKMLQATLRFRNESSRALALALRGREASALDSLGGRWTMNQVCGPTPPVTGMDAGNRGAADASLELAPGESRDATFTLAQGQRNKPYGDAFNFDLGLDQLEPLPGQQLRRTRQHSLSFANLKEMGMPVGRALPGIDPKGHDAVRAIRGAVDALKALGNSK